MPKYKVACFFDIEVETASEAWAKLQAEEIIKETIPENFPYDVTITDVFTLEEYLTADGIIAYKGAKNE